MKVQMKEIVLAVPALSKLSAGDLQLRLAYKLKRMITALQKEADFFAELSVLSSESSRFIIT